MVDEVLTLHPSLAESLPTLTDPAVALDELDLGRLPSWVPPGMLLAGLKFLMKPLSRFGHALVFGAMDDKVRAILGVEWTKRDERYLRRFFALYRLALRILPERITYSPLAYARKHQRVIPHMRKRELRDFTMHDKGEPSAVRRAREAQALSTINPREPQHPPDGGLPIVPSGPIVPVSSSGSSRGASPTGSVTTRRPSRSRIDQVDRSELLRSGSQRAIPECVDHAVTAGEARQGGDAVAVLHTRRQPDAETSTRVEPPTNGADDGLAVPLSACGGYW